MGVGPIMDADLVHALHASASPTAALAGARRGRDAVWLEAATSTARGALLLLRFCCAASPLPVDVWLDGASGMVYTAASATPGAGQGLLEAALARTNARRCAPGGKGGASPPSLLQAVALLTRELSAGEWPGGAGGETAAATSCWASALAAPGTAPLLAAQTVAALAALSHHPSLPHGAPAGGRLGAAVAGLGVHAAALTTAAHTVRVQLVCHPVPGWLLDRKSVV